MAEMRNAYNILVQKLEGMNDDINIHLREKLCGYGLASLG
jgi:hypothetical protein